MAASLPQKLLVEAIGTFFLMLLIGLTVSSAGPFAPLGFGAGLVALIYAGGHISGSVYNPAVAVGLVVRGLLGVREAGAFVATQVAAAVAAGGAHLLIAPPVEAIEMHVGRGFLGELLFTFALMWVICQVATSEGTRGNEAWALAIGFIVMGGAYAVGPITGASFNPAVAVGLAVVGLLEWPDVLVHLVACPLGAVLAVVAFRASTPHPQDREAPVRS